MGANVYFGAYKPAPIQNQDFNISLKMDKEENSFVPLGIEDFNGKEENSFFIFDYTLTGSDIDALYFQVADSNGNVLFAMGHLAPVVVSASKKPILQAMKPKKPQPPEKTLQDILTEMTTYTKQGSYSILWDGFDNDGIYDSTKLNGKTLKAKIKGVKAGVEQTVETEFTLSYKEVDWVDIKINKNTKQIDTTLRIYLKDGGAKGLSKSNYKDPLDDPRSPASHEKDDWENIPNSVIQKEGYEPIKQRTKSFEDLKQLAIGGLTYHWGRNSKHSVAKNVTVNSQQYEVFMSPIDTEDKSIEGIKLIYNTNGDWLRSGNPGTVEDPISFVGNIVSRQAICYNTGYIKNDKRWRFQLDTDESIEFAETSAHEIGHSILKAYGGTIYSYGHKGTVNTYTQRSNDNATTYPKSGEIDIMPYYTDWLPYNQRNRVVAAEADVLSLVWLTKLKIK